MTTVNVVKYKNRNWQLRWHDSDGKEHRLSAGSRDKAEVEAKRKEVEAKLLLGQPILNQRQQKHARPHTGGDTLWPVFSQFYFDQKVSHQSESTQDSTEPMLAVFDRLNGNKSIRQVAGKQYIAELKDRLRAGQGSRNSKPRSDATVNCYLRTLRAALIYAHEELGWLDEKPKIKLIKESDDGGLAKGRPVTADEVQQMIKAVPDVCLVQPEEYQYLLRGFYTTGLRLSEAMKLTYDDDSTIHLQKTKNGLAIVFPAASQKNRKRQVIPTTPEFAALLEELPRKSGFVFRPARQDGKTGRPTAQVVGRKVTEIGEAAGIKVNDKGGFAGAHSLRRGFAQKLADSGVTPKDLKFIMRHSSIQTTMSYYTTQNVDEANDRIRAVLG